MLDRLPRTATDDVEALAVAARDGNLDALGELYERFADPVLKFLALRLDGDVVIAEDVAGDVWERIARHIGRYEARRGGFVSWLFTIARNTLIDKYRRWASRQERLTGDMIAVEHLAPQPAGPGRIAEDREVADTIAAAVNDLSGCQRECVLLRFYVGLSLTDTAAHMGKQVNAVKQLQHRALKALSARLTFLDPRDMGADTLVTWSAAVHT